MTTFVVKKKISLDFLGEDWKECYLEMTPFTFADNDKILRIQKLSLQQVNMTAEEAQHASTEILNLVADKLISGKGYNGESLIPITRENLSDLPIEVIVHALKELQGRLTLPPNV